MLIDAHCHPTDHPETLASIASHELRSAAMSTRFDDLGLVSEIATQFPDKITPAFGLHPWYSHLVYTDDSYVDKLTHYKSVSHPTPQDDHPILHVLPDPVPLSKHIQAIEGLFSQHPNALLGEAGLDTKFKIKCNGTMYPFRVSSSHQRAVLHAQLKLASVYRRPASLHGVGSPQASYDEISTVSKESQRDPSCGALGSICLHSYGGSPDFYTQCWRKLPLKIYLSMTPLISDRLRPQRREAWLSATDPSLILTESDFNRSDPCQIELVKASLKLSADHFKWTPAEAEKNIERNYIAYITPNT